MTSNRCMGGLILLLLILSGTITYFQLISQSPQLLPHPSPHSQKDLSPLLQGNYDYSSSSSFIQKQLANSELSYQEYVRKRRERVGSDPRKVVPWPGQGEVIFYWDYFLPTFSCPYTTQRIGKLGDGGKYICGFELYAHATASSSSPPSEQSKTPTPPPCILYSFGVSYESSFEAEFLARTPCHIWAYDASVTRMGPQFNTYPVPRVHFSPIYLSSNQSSNATLGALMKQNGHTHLDFLKMDIEGGEFGVLEEILASFQVLPFSQFAVEIHADQKGTSFPVLYKLWERLEAKGLRPFKSEVNHYPCIRTKLTKPTNLEYAFINTVGPGRLLPQNTKLY